MTSEPTILFCVGATKAGTTWLYEHLSAHPDCHLRAIKELHYFDTLESGAYQPQIKAHHAYLDRLRARMLVAEGEGLARATRKMNDVLQWQAIMRQRAANLPAYLDYLTDGREDCSLVADITPSYALLPEQRLTEMATLTPSVRFVYLMRDPVSRLWSHIKMVARRSTKAAEAVPAACYALLENVLNGVTSGMTERGDYAGAIARLNAAVDPTRLCVMFMEAMMTPAGLDRLSGFLGIRPMDADFGRRVHAGPDLAMSDDQIQRARVLLRPQYEFVARHYPDIPANWRKNMGEL